MMEAGEGIRRYEVVEGWPQLPQGMTWGQVVQVVVDAQDRVFIFQRGQPRVTIFTTDGEYLGEWESGDRFPDLHAAFLGTDREGEYLLIVDRDRNAIARTTLDGEVVWERQSGRFDRPTDAAVAPNGDIYVSDGYGNPFVHRLSSDGEHIATWGRAGSEPGEFHLPHGIWVTSWQGRECVYVCDRENRRIQRFSLDGEYLGDVTGLNRPTDVLVDADGVRYVSELLHRVTILDADDRVIAHLGGESKAEPGSFVAPHSVWLDSQGSLYVTEVLEGRRVQKFARI